MRGIVDKHWVGFVICRNQKLKVHHWNIQLPWDQNIACVCVFKYYILVPTFKPSRGKVTRFVHVLSCQS